MLMEYIVYSIHHCLHTHNVLYIYIYIYIYIYLFEINKFNLFLSLYNILISNVSTLLY